MRPRRLIAQPFRRDGDLLRTQPSPGVCTARDTRDEILWVAPAIVPLGRTDV
jgi:hypothetical protein